MSGTGIVRDNLFIQHDPGDWHPESPKRLEALYNHLDSRAWPGVVALDRRLATRDEITLVHTQEHFDNIARTQEQSQSALDADTHVSAKSYEAALAAAGGLINLTERVLDGDLDNGFALVRPPGHHAESNRAMGFCLFNNVAVAAAWALKHRRLSRIMIVDWDLHHGNGTQHSFYSDPRVLYLSTHQYPYYPGTGAAGETGRDKGLGYTVNIPLTWGHGDEEYVSIFKRIVLPVARLYRPELILVSAGFDIYKSDPLGDMRVSTEGFAALARILLSTAGELCQGRIVFTLEGGYHVDGQASGIGKILDVMTGTGSAGKDLFLQNPPEPEIVAQIRRTQARYWDI
jgi:acetoin utilization deacetylase AcuC-like enzyme